MMGKEEDFLEIRPTGRDSPISVIFYEAHRCGEWMKKTKRQIMQTQQKGKV